MVGWAVRIRCVECRCHCFLGDASVPPDITVILSYRCRCRRCRGKGPTYFFVRNGRAKALTRKEREDIIAASGRSASSATVGLRRTPSPATARDAAGGG